MKKYNNCFPEYGQCLAGRIAYWEKMGVASGIMDNIRWHMRDKNMKASDWDETIDVGNGNTIKERSIMVVIPTSADFHDITNGDYPTFTYMGKTCVIDMLCLGGELQFHAMMADWKKEEFTNGYWHTVREGLGLQDTCVLFEYIQDKLKELIILPPEDTGKYNSTGALGVRIDKE